MRLSVKKGARAALSSGAYRKFGVSRVFCEMWDTANLNVCADCAEKVQCYTQRPFQQQSTFFNNNRALALG